MNKIYKECYENLKLFNEATKSLTLEEREIAHQELFDDIVEIIDEEIIRELKAIKENGDK